MRRRSRAGSTKPRRRMAPAAKRRRRVETIRGVTSSASKEEDGTVKHVDADILPVFSATGEFAEIIATAVDVTERRPAEEALRRSEAWLAQAQRLSRTGTWVMNGKTRRFLYWSDESYRIWGLIRFRAFQAETICGDAFTQTIEKGCGKKSRRHCASKETSLRSSESYCLMEESNTWKQTPIMNFPHSARYSRSFAQTST